jgi:hypothetical protein
MDKDKKALIQYALEQLSNDALKGLNKGIVLNFPLKLWYEFALVCYNRDKEPRDVIKQFLTVKTSKPLVYALKEHFNKLIK